MRRRVSGCFCGVLILAGLWGFYGVHLFGLDASSFAYLSTTETAAWRWMDGVRDVTPWFYPWFWPSAVLLLTGVGLASWSQQGSFVTELGEPLQAKGMSSFSRIDFLRPGIAIASLLGLVAVGLIGVAVGRGNEFRLWCWVMAIVAVMAGCFAKDCAATETRVGAGFGVKQMLLTRAEVSALVVTFIHLLALAWLHRVPELRVWITLIDLGALMFCWWRWPGRTTFWLLQLLLVVSMFYYVVDIESWRYGAIGDEFDFYDMSRWLVANPENRSYLDGVGVYGHHPLSASFHQSWVETFLGGHAYGWRMSGVLCAHLAGLALFAVLRGMMNARYALIGCAALLASHRMVAMAMTGYNQMQGLAVMVLFWAVLLLAIKRGSYLGYALAGVLALGGLFTFTLAVPLALIGAALMLIAGFPKRVNPTVGEGPTATSGAAESSRRYTLAPFCVFLIALALVALPRVLDMSWTSGQLELTGLAETEVAAANPWQRAGLNAAYTVLSLGQIRQASHYTSGPLLDPLSALAFIVGVVWLIAGGWRIRYGRWQVLSVILAIAVIGGLCVHPYPTNTRLFILVPIYAVILTVGVRQGGYFLGRTRPLWGMRWIAGVGFVAALFALNWWQLHGVLDRTFERNPYHYVLKMLIEEGGRRPVFIVGMDGTEPDENLWKALTVHGYSKNNYTHVPNVNPLERFREIARQSPAALVCLRADSQRVAEWREAAGASFEEGGRWAEHVVKDGTGVTQLITFELIPETKR